MNIFRLAQYFTVTLALTITVGLFTLKPTVTPNLIATTQTINIYSD